MNEIVERIKNGTRPTEILREWLAENPDLTGNKLGNLFMDKLPGVSGGAGMAIANWKEVKRGGCDDHAVDGVVTHWMKRAGLL